MGSLSPPSYREANSYTRTRLSLACSSPGASHMDFWIHWTSEIFTSRHLFFCWCYLLSYLGIFNRCLGLPKPSLLSCRYRTSVSNFVSMNVPWNPSHVHFRRVFSLGSVRSSCSVNYSILTLCSWAGAFMRRVGYKVIVCLWEARQYYWTRIWKNGIYAGLTMYSVCGNPTYQCIDRLIARCTAGR